MFLYRISQIPAQNHSCSGFRTLQNGLFRKECLDHSFFLIKRHAVRLLTDQHLLSSSAKGIPSWKDWGF